VVREPTVGDVTGDGAVDVWRTFYERSFPEVTQYAMRLTGGRTAAAEDLVHDGYLAMVRAWQRGAVDGLENCGATTSQPVTRITIHFTSDVSTSVRLRSSIETACDFAYLIGGPTT